MRKAFTRFKVLFFHFILFFFIPLWLLQRLIPRKKNLWVFGAWHGRKFSDNSKELFLKVANDHKDIKPVWLSRDKRIINDLRGKGFKSYKINSYKGIVNSLRAKVIIISSSKSDINPFFINGAKLIQIWHGAPMKKIGMSMKISKRRKIFLEIQKKLFPFKYEYTYDYVVSTSNCFDKILSESLLVPSSNIIVSGYPRNDILFKKNFEHNMIQKWNQKFDYPKKIIYLPTFRSVNDKTDYFYNYGYDEKKMNSILEKFNAIFITKGHFCDNQISSSVKYKRIINLSDSELNEVNPLLKDIDLLLTDYSGVYYDFLLTLRPIIFTPFDLDTYITINNGLNFNYQNNICGPMTKNWNEVVTQIEKIFLHDDYLDLRMKKNQYFNKYNDGNSSVKLYKKIRKIVN